MKNEKRYNITVKVGNASGSIKDAPLKEVARVALIIAGGGYTEKQTAKAMLIQSDLLAGKPRKTSDGGIITVEEV